MNVRSERLKKLEIELSDLQQWLNLGLVPKKDVEKHKQEISTLEAKIAEEKERLRFLKENGEVEEFTIPKRQAGRQPLHEPHSLPDMDMGDEGLTDAGLDMETEPFDIDASNAQEDDGGDSETDTSYEEDEDEEDPFSDRNRWRRGILEDPDADNW